MNPTPVEPRTRRARPAVRLLTALVLALAATVALTGPASASTPAAEGTGAARIVCPTTADDSSGRALLPCRPCPRPPVTAERLRRCPPCLARRGSTVRHCPAPGPELPPGVLRVQDFAAFVDALPPGPRTLIVSGNVVVASPAYHVRLEPAVPQGINPRILLLRLVSEFSPSPVPQVVTTVPVRFESTAVDYDAVTVLPMGLDLKVETAV